MVKKGVKKKKFFLFGKKKKSALKKDKRGEIFLDSVKFFQKSIKVPASQLKKNHRKIVEIVDSDDVEKLQVTLPNGDQLYSFEEKEDYKTFRELLKTNKIGHKIDKTSKYQQILNNFY